jgi:hypothetical protein
LASLELIHFDLCEINGGLEKCEKKYFMTLIDDIYKDEVKNQVERKIKLLKLDHLVSIFKKYLMNFTRNTILFMRGYLHIRSNQIGLLREKTACSLTS